MLIFQHFPRCRKHRLYMLLRNLELNIQDTGRILSCLGILIQCLTCILISTSWWMHGGPHSFFIQLFPWEIFKCPENNFATMTSWGKDSDLLIKECKLPVRTDCKIVILIQVYTTLTLFPWRVKVYWKVNPVSPSVDLECFFNAMTSTT